MVNMKKAIDDKAMEKSDMFFVLKGMKRS